MIKYQAKFMSRKNQTKINRQNYNMKEQMTFEVKTNTDTLGAKAEINRLNILGGLEEVIEVEQELK